MLRILLMMGLLLSQVAFANAIPPALNEWSDWVLRDTKDASCPYLAKKALTEKRCAWPSALNLTVNSNGASFTQQWDVLGDSQISLPGDKKHWPTQVKVNGSAIAVAEVKNIPMVFLKKGIHTISGEISWQSMPQYLAIANDTALIKLNINGKLVTPNRAANGRLWLNQKNTIKAEANQGDAVKVEVFRRLSDGVPTGLLTELRIAVAGAPRELLLGQLLPDGAEPLSFNSPLPARIEDDGRLRLQARPGQWVIQLNARYLQVPTQFSIRKLDADWPSQEAWSFQSMPTIRGVKLSGVPAVDPSQIDLPSAFAQLPTYILSEGDVLTIEEQYRGDATPAANELSLRRTLWMDFDGKAATVRDNITGSMTHGWRLRASDDLELGRVEVQGQPQLVTTLAGEENAGVEIRQRQVNVNAVSRLGNTMQWAASGWQHDMNALAITLNLPPGWLIWHASGPDSVSQSWLSRWDLWDVFLCLLIIGSVYKILCWRWALLAALTLALTYHVSGVPIIGWVVLIMALPLLKALPQGVVRTIINVVALVASVAVILAGLNFSVAKIRQALYPQLEMHQSINNYTAYDDSMGGFSSLDEANADFEEEVEVYDLQQAPMASQLQRKTLSKANRSVKKNTQKQRYQVQQNVQTGPGLPTWNWRAVNLRWSGPVRADEQVRLYLTPPWLTRILYCLQVILVGLLIYALVRAVFKQARGPLVHSGAGHAAVAVALSVLGASAVFMPVEPLHAQTYPSQEMLEQLKDELLKKPICEPHCISIEQVALEVDEADLGLQMRISSQTALAVPMPTATGWWIERATLNGNNTSLARDHQKVWLNVPAGVHRVRLEGSINSDQLTIDFPETPHNVSVSAKAWDVNGLVKQSLSGRALQLNRRQQEQREDTLLPDPIKPFVMLDRTFDLDMDWVVTTRVRRVAPQQGAINLRVPLMQGESVVSRDVTVEDGHVLVSLSARQSQVQWQSVLPPASSMVLSAAQSGSWNEVWNVSSSERWHIQTEGLVPVKSSGASQRRTWRPRAGETVTLNAVQPKPMAGATTTVEHAKVNYRPGARSAALTLDLSIRTSLGGDFPIKLLEQGVLQSISIDGVEQTRPKDDDTVMVSLRPGLQKVSVEWELSQGVTQLTDTPVIELPVIANNIDLNLELPRSRWPLYVGGPNIGPAMLYWGVLLVVCAIAVVLGRLVGRYQLSIPLNSMHWLLLAIGISTVSTVVSVPVVIWFFAMEARRRVNLEPNWHNLLQIGLVVLTLIAIVCLCVTIPQSLLSTPNMQVTGNGSSNYFYQWYQDHSAQQLPIGWVMSVPLSVYRVAMLLWSLWLVFALLRWAKWGWDCFNTGELWKQMPAKVKEATDSLEKKPE